MKRLEALDTALQERYNVSLYSESYAWLLDTVRGLNDKGIQEVLTDANMHSIREDFETLRQQRKAWRIYQGVVYRLWCFVGKAELKIRHHGQRIGAIRG